MTHCSNVENGFTKIYHTLPDTAHQAANVAAKEGGTKCKWGLRSGRRPESKWCGVLSYKLKHIPWVLQSYTTYTWPVASRTGRAGCLNWYNSVARRMGLLGIV